MRREQFRNRILDAAEELILERGDVSFSTRDLAVRADVSMATPFNHFKSKLGILDAVIGRSLTQIKVDPGAKTSDPIDQLFLAADQVVKFYARNAKLYRPVFGAVLGAGSPKRPSASLEYAVGTWRFMLTDAQQAGLIEPNRNIDAIADLIEANWLGTALSWIHNGWGHTAWRDRVRYTIALTLCGVVTDRERPRLLKMAAAVEKII